MIRKEAKGLVWYEFEKLSHLAGLRHGSFTKQGGVSPPPFSSLNLGDGLGDGEVNLRENRQRICEALDLPKLRWAKQVHGIDLVDLQTDAPLEIPECDAFVTAEPGLALLVKHADCQATIIYDPVQRIIANVHSGWRGNAQNIYSVVIDYLVQTYQSSPEDLIACISPSLGPDAAEFQNYREEFPESFWVYETRPQHFDLWAIAEMQLLKKGLLLENIEIARICTRSEERDFFSYRRDKRTGRMGTVAMLV